MPRSYSHKLLFAAFRLSFWTHSYWQCKQIDETFGVFGVVAAHGEAGQIGAIEREGRNALRDVERTLPEFQTDHGNGSAGFEPDFDFFGLVRSFFRGDDPLPHRFVRSVRGVFKLAAFVAEVPNVTVAAVNVFLALLDGDIVLLGIGDGVFA